MFNLAIDKNEEAQSFATVMGAVNLAAQLERKETPEMLESLLSCLYVFLKTSNLIGKQQYLAEMGGLVQLSEMICWQGKNE